MKFDDLSFDEAPVIKCELPGKHAKHLLDLQSKYEGGAVSYPKGSPTSFAKAFGATIEDLDGNVFIDFFGGAGVLALGHCNPYIQEKVSEVQQNLTHSLDFPSVFRYSRFCLVS
ncbi:MAG: aminotransferase class III-fold pyridoxal phosphate-dependent enzyme [Candidatus Heimdallarchaeaceae archaeon]